MVLTFLNFLVTSRHKQQASFLFCLTTSCTKLSVKAYKVPSRSSSSSPPSHVVASRNVEVTKIVPTPLRANPLYYKIYCVATNSLVVSEKKVRIIEVWSTMYRAGKKVVPRLREVVSRGQRESGGGIHAT